MRVRGIGYADFVVNGRDGVDAPNGELAHGARGEPVENERYESDQFFTDDGEGRTVEAQGFLHATEPI